ncbi:MAG: 2,3-bisphosphoglycerate-independent phosphoglycerate mutase [Flavobacteriales bacterium]|nr:2,3-bisphosphoglycerate-independent phosphoglycerate mutase [Flavobacteriales bacterium]
MAKKAVLIILDGWGIGSGGKDDAIAQARTPFIDSLLASAPHASLRTDGSHVGLPEGQMGNSEVGHLNIGAGRVVHQDLVRIDRAIADGSLRTNPALKAAFAHARSHGGRLHLLGLLSDGGVHSMRTHAEALCKLAHAEGIKETLVHAFTDGRDTDPRSGQGYMERFLQSVAGTGARLASIIGRYYAMDRDKRWERVKVAYDLLVHGAGERVTDPLLAFDRSYAQGVTDEFMKPHAIIRADDIRPDTLADGDAVICFNFRTDRCREITQALTQRAFPEYGMMPLKLHMATMTEYDATYSGVSPIFRKDDLRMTLGEAVSLAGLQQIRIAETEKYPHVTFFFSGGREEPFPGERRLLLPSPKVATYDLQPAMSAQAIADAIVPELLAGAPDLVVLNFANPDMVGHTGVFDAIIEAVETTDACARQVVEAARKAGYQVLIIADHGNADKAMNTDGSPNTAHTTNPVPVITVTEAPIRLRDGILADVAPTLLDLMGMEKPVEMTGSSLIVR